MAALGEATARLRERPESLVACGTLQETIEQVLAEVGVRLFVGVAGENTAVSTDSVWLGVVLDPDVVGVTIIDSTSERDWADNSGPARTWPITEQRSWRRHCVPCLGPTRP